MKKEIISRLVEAGHITFDEALILMETETKTEKVIVKEIIKEVSNPYPKYQPVPYWLQPGFKGFEITC